MNTRCIDKGAERIKARLKELLFAVAERDRDIRNSERRIGKMAKAPSPSRT